MTIRYKNTRGVEFRIDVLIVNERIHCKVQVTATKQAYLSTSTFIVPYSFLEVIIPFDFNGTENSIAHAFQSLFHGTEHKDVRGEDLVDAVDLVMAENENLMGMEIIEPHRIITRTSV
ncbi:betaC1 protein [Cotton leaf curl Gezira betasatellite]|uniref:BetaC1 protein n=1 Tax=Cotton leaf curl Burkina Faso betasatellite TaxID=2844026 RepID=A0A5C1D4W9_9VIRU|nr:betaC1 protein [Cotton leaf curl Gezira betasatellite]QEL50696.1 betaC1 protein [Cotton leaf curl Gezira betasatellite]